VFLHKQFPFLTQIYENKTCEFQVVRRILETLPFMIK